MPAFACAFQAARYVPDPGDKRPQKNHYSYAITVQPGNVLTLNVIEPWTQEVESRLRMQYRPQESPAPLLSISRKEALPIQFFDKSFIEVHPSGMAAEAPAYMILHDSYARFLNLPVEDMDVEYLTAQKVVPGARVDDKLELIPDTWVLDGCPQGAN